MMQKKVVISQSMYFPWVGLLEQIQLSNIFVHYDDVPFSKGSFTNRVQVKTSAGIKWLTIPLRKFHLGEHIDEIEINEATDWRSQHRDILRQAYFKAPFRDEMLDLVDNVFSKSTSLLADLVKMSVIELADYFDISSNRRFISSKELKINGSSSQRVHDIVKHLGGKTYITGHGACNYLDYELFEKSYIAVQYMQYQCNPYTQLHGDFTPYVTALDLVANYGRSGKSVIKSESVNWKQFERIDNE